MAEVLSKAFRANLLLTALTVSAVGLTASPNTALAADCLAAPNSPAPKGTHWYYHLDRAAHRKCWYTGTADHSAQRATAATRGPTTPSGRILVESVSDTTPSPSISTPSLPSVKMSASEENTALLPSPKLQNMLSSAEEIAPPQAAWPDPAPAVASSKSKDSNATAPASPRNAVVDPTRKTDRTGGGIPNMIFPVLALGAAVFSLGALAIINRRRRTLIDASADQGHEEDQSALDGSVDKGQFSSFITAVSDSASLTGEDVNAFGIGDELSERTETLARLRLDIDQMLRAPGSVHPEPLRRRTAA
jgi:hypothetical protein